MRIATIGTGNMARTLGALWAERGHQVFFGSRDARRGAEVAAFIGRGTVGGINDEAAAFGEVILHTARHHLPSSLLASTEVLANKVIVDCNNSRIPPRYEYEPITISIAERLAQDVPQARVVKAFNTMAQEIFEHAPEPLRQYGVSCFVCGDDREAKTTVMRLAEELGLTPLDCGPLRRARLVEGLADFARYAMGRMGMGLGPYATISVKVLPQAPGGRFGGRRPSALE